MIRTSFRARAAAFALLFAALGGAREAAAQSLLSSRGLGYPLEPLNARQQALGGITTGLNANWLNFVNPADAAGLPASGFTFTFQPDWFDSEAGGEADRGSTARFPTIFAAVPVRRATLFAGYGAMLDQHWQVERSDSITLGGERVAVTDRFVSDGGIGRFRAGLAVPLHPRVAVGAAIDLITGEAADSVSRTIEGYVPFLSAVDYTYEGTSFTGGARWVPSAALSLGASVQAGGTIKADSRDSLSAGTREYAAPVRVDVGASGRIAQTLLVAVGGQWTGWSSADEDLAEAGGARDAMTASAGIEYDGIGFLGRPVPLRVGARYSELPFRWGDVADGNEFPTERALTAGLGIRFAGGAATLDVSGERGQRGGDAAGIDESFWRMSLSISLLGR